MNPDKLQGRIALVTGVSRRQGIGASICRILATAGADIFFTYWQAYDHTMPWGADDAGPLKLQQELQALGVRAASLEVDLSNPEAATQVLDTVEAKLGNLSRELAVSSTAVLSSCNCSQVLLGL